MGGFEYNDLGVRVYNPEIRLTRELNQRLTDRLSGYYNNQSQKPDQLTFSVTEQRLATISTGIVTVSDVFDDERKAVLSRVFDILNAIVTTAELPSIITHDFVVSAVFSPDVAFCDTDPLGSYDYLGRKFLKDLDFSPLGAENPSTGINWVFQRQDKTYTLKFEPFSGHPDEIFVDMVVNFPDEQVSVLEMKSSAEGELDYFERDVLGFLKARFAGA